MTKVVVRPKQAAVEGPKRGDQQQGRVEKREGLIGRMVRIIKLDILSLIYGERIKKPQEWEDYKNWCDLARGDQKK